MKKGLKILYVCQEAKPYLPENAISSLCRELPPVMQERGAEIRTFMPKFGSINERRNQLHEVIRLSGMNIIIDDNDHQLIIKVASIPSARMQVYFIDNDDFFSRKCDVRDVEGVLYPDNDERSLFFARGVIETIGKLRWSPDVVHCHGWFSALMPVYVKRLFADNPLFASSKVIISLYDDMFTETLDVNLGKKLIAEGVDKTEAELLQRPDYVALMKFAIQYADGIVVAGENIPSQVIEFAASNGVKILDIRSAELSEEKYDEFYCQIVD